MNTVNNNSRTYLLKYESKSNVVLTCFRIGWKIGNTPYPWRRFVIKIGAQHIMNRTTTTISIGTTCKEKN